MKLKTFIVAALESAIAIPLTATFWIAPAGATTLPTALMLTQSPQISVRTVYYPIVGSTVKQLRAQMDRLGPLDPDSGLRYDGYTDWDVRWKYRHSASADRCSISSLDVKTSIIMTLPRWQVPRNAFQQLRNKWNRYIAAVQVHENGHKKHGVDASHEIVRTLRSLPAYPSCNQVGGAANAAGDRIIKQYNQRDLSYDQTTRHGATQGAVFP